MSNLDDITVRIEPAGSPSQVMAILSELLNKLNALSEQGINDSIDLRSLPMFPGDYEQLKETLGYGEIHVTIDAMGPTEIYETAIPGIWWVSHSNSEDENIAEYLQGQGISRRGFLKFCAATASMLALSPGMAGAIADALGKARRPRSSGSPSRNAPAVPSH